MVGCEDDDDCVSDSCGSSNTCECVPDAPGDVCGAMECGNKPNGCGGMLTCPFTCGAMEMCTANACVAVPQCDPDDCSGCPFLQRECCTGQDECGCESIFGGSCS
jgi:hypothetical protein